MSDINNDDYLLYTLFRKGTSDDPYIEKSEEQQVHNCIVRLSEIPQKQYRVAITSSDNSLWYEIDDGLPEINQYKVNYNTGAIQFSSDNEAKTFTFNYLSIGQILINSERVKISLDQGLNVQDTLQKLIDDNRTDGGLAHRKSPVNTYNDIATTYPLPVKGDMVQTLDTNKMWIWTGQDWYWFYTFPTQQVMNLQNNVTDIYNKIGDLSQLPTTDKSSLVNSNKEIVSQLAEKVPQINYDADRSYILAQIQALTNGFGESYSTVAELNTAHPNGDNKNHVVEEDGNWYFWLEGAGWTSGGTFQDSSNIQSINKDINNLKDTLKQPIILSFSGGDVAKNDANGQIAYTTDDWNNSVKYHSNLFRNQTGLPFDVVATGGYQIKLLKVHQYIADGNTTVYVDEVSDWITSAICLNDDYYYYCIVVRRENQTPIVSVVPASTTYWLRIESTSIIDYIDKEIITESTARNADKNDLESDINKINSMIELNNLLLNANQQLLELNVQMKAGIEYTFSLDDYPSSTIDFYTNSDRVNGYLGADKSFRTTIKEFSYTPTEDLSVLYLKYYGSPTVYKVRISTIENIVDRINYNTSSLSTLSNKVDGLSSADKNRKAVILDTDFGGDIDDLSAIAVLLWAERVGLVDIIGIVESYPRVGTNGNNQYYTSIGALDALCTYFGVDNMAFGIDIDYAPTTSNYCGTACTYYHTLYNNTDAEDSPNFYRRALASLPDGEKCDVIIIGYTTAFSRFLDSASDAYSPLNGSDLANNKINKLWIVGGQYPNGKVETNLAGGDPTPVAKNVNATANVLAKFTGDIIFLGAEQGDIHTGDILYDNNLTWSMLYKCMNEFMTASFNGGSNAWGYTTLEETWKGKDYAWDPQMVLAACEDSLSSSGYRLIRGTNTIDTDSESPTYGENTFTLNTTGNHYYVKKLDGRDASWFTHRLDSIIKEDAWANRSTGRVRLARV